jgi:GST-like protein
MLVLYTAPTHNGMRAAIALAESGLEYTTRKIDLAAGEQRAHDYLAINPAGRIPALVDPHGPEGELHLSQSGAIMIYVAGKATHLWPSKDLNKVAALQWLMWACTDVAQTSSMVWQSRQTMPEKSAANTEYCEQRLLRWLREAEAQLAHSEFLAGELCIADYALFPVVHVYNALVEQAGLTRLLKWYEVLHARPGVQRGLV